jgi:glyoxylase-like metal-dependent hydrolase (beta-lactamase superfamily II)
VDADYEELAGKLEAAVAGLVGEAAGEPPVTWLVNTHWHFDHVGGNAHLAGRGALLIAHENVRKRLAAGQTISTIDVEVPPAPAAALPVITFTDGLTFHLGDETVTLHPVGPAHTDGDVAVRFHGANVVHTGDLVFSGGYPFIDLSSDGHIDGMIAGLETVLELCDDETVIIPGHGALLDRAGLVAYVGMLRAFRDVIAAEIAAGHDLAAIQAARPTASIDETWGQTMFSPEMFTQMVYGSLQPE